MTPGALLLALVLMILLPVSGILAGIMAWNAFRAPVPNWRAIRIAVVILVVPYVLAAIIEPRGGLSLAFSDHPLALISKIVAIGIVIATVRRRR